MIRSVIDMCIFTMHHECCKFKWQEYEMVYYIFGDVHVFSTDLNNINPLAIKEDGNTNKVAVFLDHIWKAKRSKCT